MERLGMCSFYTRKMRMNMYIYMYILSIEEEIDIRIYLEKNTDTGVKT